MCFALNSLAVVAGEWLIAKKRGDTGMAIEWKEHACSAVKRNGRHLQK